MHSYALIVRPYHFLVAGLVLVATTAWACQVPVFRYALERWPADRYEIVVLHEGSLSESDGQSLQELREASTNLPVNFSVRNVDVTVSKNKELLELYEEHASDRKPLMVALYPRNAQEVPDRIVGVFPLGDDVNKHLADSPVRQKIANKLISGESAVWIFVPSGDAKQDAVAKKMLVEQVAANGKNLELPEQEDPETEEELLQEVDIELRIGFSIVTLNRDDPKEQFLLKMLLGSEPDLEELKQPMAFPVLGRGRVLYALVGKGIAEQTIGMASRFIVGPCSCQVKEQNPGFDLLMSFDWDEKIAGSTISDPPPDTSEPPRSLIIPPGKSKR